jgi:CRP/FNR family transcriptional regulator, cyclic AMP receptor protein
MKLSASPSSDWIMARKVKGSSFDPNLLLATAGRGRTKLEYRSEGVVFSQGDAADSIFYILRGKIKIVVTSKQGREAVVAVLGEGDFFGEGCLIAQPLRLATAASMTDATMMRVEKAEMLRLLHAEPDFAEVFTVHLLTRNSRVEADLADHLFNSSEKRLARALLLLANFGKEGRPEPIIAKISQETLAEMIGTTRPRVSFFMNKFRKLGFIEYNGGLKVHSSLLGVVLRD